MIVRQAIHGVGRVPSAMNRGQQNFAAGSRFKIL